ncbi:hypothetical protein ACFL0U_04025 [Pseudomonadota bacterium]
MLKKITSNQEKIRFLAEQKVSLDQTIPDNCKRFCLEFLNLDIDNLENHCDSLNLDKNTTQFKEIKEKLKRMQEYSNELKNKSLCDLNRIYKEKYTSFVKEREKNYFFNIIDAEVDLDFYGRMERWTEDEAIAISLGKDPRIVNQPLLKGLSFCNTSPFCIKYFERLEALRRTNSVMKVNHGQEVISLSFLTWLRDNDFFIPEKLGEFMQKKYQLVSLKKSYEKQRVLIEKQSKLIEKFKNFMGFHTKAIEELKNEVTIRDKEIAKLHQEKTTKSKAGRPTTIDYQKIWKLFIEKKLKGEFQDYSEQAVLAYKKLGSNEYDEVKDHILIDIEELCKNQNIKIGRTSIYTKIIDPFWEEISK